MLIKREMTGPGDADIARFQLTYPHACPRNYPDDVDRASIYLNSWANSLKGEDPLKNI
jgi:hypothetical protein